MDDETTGPMLVDLLRSRLSAHGIAYLGDERRSPELAADPDRLRSMLVQRGLPVFDKVLEYEATFGGIVEEIAAWETRGTKARRFSADRLVHYHGKPLLPLDMTEPYERWMDEEGAIYIVDQDVDYCEPQSSSLVHGLEKRPFYDEIMDSHSSPMSRTPRRKHSLSLAFFYGDPVARALRLARFEPAGDRYSDIWFDETRLLVETRLRGMDESTRLLSAHMDDIVHAVEAVNVVDPLAAGQLEGEDPGLGQPGDPIVARLLRFAGRPLRGDVATEEIVFVGAPGRYGAVTRPLAEPVALPSRRA